MVTTKGKKSDKQFSGASPIDHKRHDSAISARSEEFAEEDETHFFGVTLTPDEHEYTWNFTVDNLDESEAEDSVIDTEDCDALKHCLYLRHITLGSGAKVGERNIVELEAGCEEDGFRAFPIASLCVGVQEMASLNFEFNAKVIVTLRLIEGSGPVSITGIHEVALQYNLEDSEIESTEDIGEVSEEVEETPSLGRKRRISVHEPKIKKVKKGNANAEEEDDSQDSESEEDDVEMDELMSKEKTEELKKKPAKGSSKGKSPKQVDVKKSKARLQMKKTKKLAA